MKMFRQGALLGAALALFVAAGHAAPITLTGPAAFDVDTPSPTLVNLFSATGGTISDLNLFLDIDANCCAYDLTVILKHLDTGTSVLIWQDGVSAGYRGFGDVRNTTFDDAAGIAWIVAPLAANNFDIVPGTYRPMGLLSAFNGESLAGTWQLSLQNTGCCFNEGDELVAWSIDADVSVPEPGTLVTMSTGLVGLIGYGLRRRRS